MQPLNFSFWCLVSFALANYAPNNTTCPHDPIVRKSDSLSSAEKDWLKGRDAKTKPVLTKWLAESNLLDFDPVSFLKDSSPRIAIALSGGGYRAMMAGAGILASMDSRTPGSMESGHMGGLYQASTYLAGLSGASFLVSSIAMEHNSPVVDLKKASDIWNFDNEFFFPGGESIFINMYYWKQVAGEVKQKTNKGFHTSMTDYYGRLFAQQLFSGDNGDKGWSSVREYPEFQSFDMPLPILVSVGRDPGKFFIDHNSTIYEMTPFEFGSWDPSLYHFIDMKYLGSKMNEGIPESCVVGFDNAAFITATSTSFFNGALLDVVESALVPQSIKEYIVKYVKTHSNTADVAHIEPNPFYGLDTPLGSENSLELVDGGEDKQSIPLYPFLQPHREVDVVFAIDLTADTFSDNPIAEYSPSGRAMVASYQRQFTKQANGTIFPHVPDDTSFIWGGMINQPIFFGCDTRNLTSLFEESVPESERFYPPVLIYIANSEHSTYPYYNTFKSRYRKEEVDAMVENGYNIMTQNNGTINNEWRTCIACATILRQQQRQNVTPTKQCQRCLEQYCWDGTLYPKVGDGTRRDGRNNLAIK